MGADLTQVHALIGIVCWIVCWIACGTVCCIGIEINIATGHRLGLCSITPPRAPNQSLSFEAA